MQLLMVDYRDAVEHVPDRPDSGCVAGSADPQKDFAVKIIEAQNFTVE